MQAKTLLAASILTLATALPAIAATTTYTVNLSGLAESPPNGSPGTGFATVAFDDVANTMALDVTFSGLLGTVTAAHIHCCTAPPNSVGVATTTPTFPGFPLGVTSGSYSNSFDMLAATSYNPGFVTLHTDVPGAYASLLAGAAAGEAYLNVHTVTFPAGEIRGFLTAAVPEPQTYAMLALGLVAVAGMARRKRSR
jgi:hypothetical protein